MVNSPNGYSIPELLTKKVILELDGLSGSDQAFVIGSLLLWIYHYRMRQPEREQLKHFILIEEAHHLFLKTAKEEDIRARFDIPKRYYQRNKEMVETCDLLYAFISKEDGFIGGTRFEVEYAVSLGIPVQIHREEGLSQWIFQYSFPFLGKRDFFLAWEGFFHKIRVQLGGAS